MRSHLLEGRVRHRRARPFPYELLHGVWYAAVDLDELDELDHRLRLFGRNRRSVVTFRDADHLPVPATDVAGDLRAHLRREGLASAGRRVTLVANLRILGYVFNPASFFLCRDAAGILRAVVVEVHNTHGERHLYTLRPETDPVASGRPFSAGMEKAFYVSPFIDMEGRYEVHVRDDATLLTIAIRELDAGGPLLATSVVLRRRALTDRGLLRMLLRYPLMTHRTIALIHWHALRLWLRGARFRRHRGAVPSAGGAVASAPAVVAVEAARSPTSGWTSR